MESRGGVLQGKTSLNFGQGWSTRKKSGLVVLTLDIPADLKTLDSGYSGNMAPTATITVFLFLSLFGLNTSLERQHYYINNSMKWSDARSYCKNYYDDLSTVSKKEMHQLSANPQITEDFFWIGLKRSFWPWPWIWTGGEIETHVNWDGGQPKLFNGDCCAVKRSSSKVHNADCDETKPFYCMEDVNMDLVLVKQESTWEEALLYCRQNYKDLASLNSDGIVEEAEDKSTEALTNDVWIGLRFIAGHWFWVNGKTFKYMGWSSGAELPCPAMSQRCAVLDRNTMVWKPVDCEQRLNFLCLS